jgi:hypothetical protein
LNDTRVSDAGLKALAALKKLEALYLDGAPVTDAGLKELAALRGLRELSLRGTEVTDAGFRRLMEALPGGRIDFKAAPTR